MSDKNRKILIIEDDEILTELLKKKIERANYEVKTALTGEEGIELVKNNPLSIGIFDYQLANCTAEEIIERLKVENALIPFIILTGQGNEDIAVRMMKAGARDYLKKDSDYLDILPQILERVEEDINTENQLLQTERALESSVDNFIQIFKNSENGIFIWKNGEATLINSALKEKLGYSSKEEIKAEDLNIENFAADKLNAKKFRKKVKKKFFGDKSITHFDFEAETRNGENIYTKINLSNITWNKSNAVLGIVTDITENKKLQREREKYVKNESLSTLAAGLAHDFNNVLSVVLGNITLLRSKVHRGEDVDDLIDSIEDTVISGTGITHQLLRFTKEEKLETSLHSIKKLLKDTVKFALSGSNVKPKFKIQKDLLPVLIDRNQIKQVITNLVINANQSMEKGGKLTVRAENEVIGEDHIHLEKNTYIKISFEDEGKGVDPDISDKIFDPYFTTRNSGNGLGLTTCLSILKKHNGWLTLDTDYQEGARFVMYLPTVETKSEIKEEDQTEQKHYSGEVLILDDMEVILDSFNYMFSLLGFTPVTTTDPKKALELYKDKYEDNDGFELVLLDLTIPDGINGLEVNRKIQQIDSDATTIICSGYSEENIIQEPHKYDFDGSITKPFSTSELRDLLQDIL